MDFKGMSYHTNTQEKFDLMLDQLYKQGFEWNSGDSLLDKDLRKKYWLRYNESTVINVGDNGSVAYGSYGSCDNTATIYTRDDFTMGTIVPRADGTAHYYHVHNPDELGTLFRQARRKGYWWGDNYDHDDLNDPSDEVISAMASEDYAEYNSMDELSELRVPTNAPQLGGAVYEEYVPFSFPDGTTMAVTSYDALHELTELFRSQGLNLGSDGELPDISEEVYRSSYGSKIIVFKITESNSLKVTTWDKFGTGSDIPLYLATPATDKYYSFTTVDDVIDLAHCMDSEGMKWGYDGHSLADDDYTRSNVSVRGIERFALHAKPNGKVGCLYIENVPDGAQIIHWQATEHPLPTPQTQTTQWKYEPDSQEETEDMSLEDQIKGMATQALQHAAEVKTDDLAKEAFKTVDDMIHETYGELPNKIEIKVNRRTPKEITGFTHNQFQTVLNLVNSSIPVMLVGPAGTGKNVTLKQVADVLG